MPHKSTRNDGTNGARRNRASFFDVNAENRLWHNLSPQAAGGALGVDRARGLDETDVVARRARYGLNRLAEKPPRSRWLLLLDQFKSLLILVLVGAALLAGAIGDLKDAVVILIVVDVINEIDASGQETVRHLVERLHAGDVTMMFSGLKQQVIQAVQQTGLYGMIGAQNLFRTEGAALEAIHQWIRDESFDAKFCPLKHALLATTQGNSLAGERLD